MKIAKCRIKTEPGYLYYVDTNGNIARTDGVDENKGKIELVKELNLKIDPGYDYYIDKDGDVSSTRHTNEKWEKIMQLMKENKTRESAIKGKNKTDKDNSLPSCPSKNPSYPQYGTKPYTMTNLRQPDEAKGVFELTIPRVVTIKVDGVTPKGLETMFITTAIVGGVVAISYHVIDSHYKNRKQR